MGLSLVRNEMILMVTIVSVAAMWGHVFDSVTRPVIFQHTIRFHINQIKQ